MVDGPLPPGMTIGILGGGQLGRMLAIAAAKLGFACHIYCPDSRSPAFAVAGARTVAAYDDESALAAFADAVDVATFEFENVPAQSARYLATRVPVRPGPKSLEVAQDRLAEKALMSELGIGTAVFAGIASISELYSAIGRTGRPAVLKTRRLGYDGKGQTVIRQGDDPRNAWRAIGEAPAILEAHVRFEREISVVLARSGSGEIRAFDIAENLHREGILEQTIVPAVIPDAIIASAVDVAASIADALGHIGVLAIEMFHLGGAEPDALLVNEIAPRVHNSGHYTTDACSTSQFEQHIRAIAGWPLGETRRHSDVVMTNLIGDAASRWLEIANDAGVSLHLYGKSDLRPGRKMGHVNRVSPRKPPS